MQDNQVIDAMLEKCPLAKFSPATQIQFDLLCRMHDRITEILETSLIIKLENLTIDSKSFRDAYDFFWLWVLGAYELVRTMSEGRSCFGEDTAAKILRCKRQIAHVRIPFAKQELRGKAGLSALGELSVHEICKDKKDMSFMIDGKEVFMKDLMLYFRDTISSIRADEIRCSFRYR